MHVLAFCLFSFDGSGFVCVGVIVLLVLLASMSGAGGRVCGHCYHANRSAAVYCARCGTRLDE